MTGVEDRRLLAAVSIAWIVGGTGAAGGGPVRLGTPQEAARDAMTPLAVMIECRSTESFGVGILAGADDERLYAATAAHVVAGCSRAGESVQVRFKGAGKAVDATVLKSSESPVDLAVIGVAKSRAVGINAAELPFDRLGDPDSLAAGDKVYLVGPNWTVDVTPGRLSRNEKGILRFESKLVRPGFSGAPLVNDRWELVGLIQNIQEDAKEAMSVSRMIAQMRAWKYPVNLRIAPRISAGRERTCSLTPDGRARCWGDIGFSVYGPGPMSGSMAIPNVRFREISVGAFHACGLDSGGSAFCWGLNGSGQLGTGSKSNSPDSAVHVQGAIVFSTVSAGGWHTCGLTPDGRAYCWGDGTEGRLGNNSGEESLTPVAVAGGLTFHSISSGLRNSCGITIGGEAYCWGGVGGTGIPRGGMDPSNAFTPAPVPGNLTFQSVSAGQDLTCGLSTSGVAYCWGAPDRDGGPGPDTFTPKPVPGPIRFQFLRLGLGLHACGIATTGIAYCWGWNRDGQLGDGSTKDSDVPVPVAGGLKFAVISPGQFHTCGVTLDGATYCWGAVELGGYGTSSKNGSTKPVRVPDNMPLKGLE